MWRAARSLVSSFALLFAAAMSPGGVAAAVTAEFAQVGTLSALDWEAGDVFGWSIDISGDTVVVGAPGVDDGTGAAYVFVRDGAGYSRQRILRASDGTVSDLFGVSVAISGDTVVVAGNNPTGRVYVYSRTGETWAETQIIPTGRVGYYLNVAIEGDTLVVGSPGGSGELGAVQIYARNEGTWSLQQPTLFSGETSTNDRFGVDVAISGDSIIIGNHGAAETDGRAYVYVRDGATWTEQQPLVASDPGPYGDQFGWDVEIEGDTAVVSANRKWFADPGFYGGKVYVFGRSGSTWTEQQTFVIDDLEPGAAPRVLGVALDFHDDSLLIRLGTGTSPLRVGPGTAYLLQRSGGTFSFHQRFEPASSFALEGSVLVTGNTLSSGTADVWNAGAGGSIGGTVEYRDGLQAEGITLTLTGSSDEGEAVSETTTTDADGEYVFTDVPPGEYDVTASGDPPDENGGTLSADPEVGGRCPGDPTDDTCHLYSLPTTPVSFIYTPCSAEDRRPNDEPPTNCPIVFVPGFLGTRIQCVADDGFSELWPNIPNVRFGEMTLAEDGFTNEGEPGSCAAAAFAVSGRHGLVGSAGPKDVYQSTIDFLDLIAFRRWAAYAYDWRRAVPVSVPGLDETIDAILEDTGATRVVLMAHSMGGLVSRLYIDDADRADKVVRFVTLGTPYWGAPKTHFALLAGDSDQPGSDTFDLDIFVTTRDLQRFARHALGAFWLYPSANFGSWLSIEDAPQDAAGVNRWIASLGAAPALLDAAQAGHAQLDGFKTNGVDYAVMVGVGLATVEHINVRQEVFIADDGYVGSGQWADLTFASGDGTVPARSATQGAVPTGTPLGENVPIHYACDVGHVDLPGNASVDSRIEDFLLAGKPVEGPEDNCPYVGVEIRSFQVDILRDDARVTVGEARARGVAAAGQELSVPEAAALGLIDLVSIGDRSTIVIDGHTPVTLQIGGEHQAMQVKTISSTGDGEWRSYPAGSEPVTIDVDGVVESDGEVVKPLTVKSKPPRTKARIRKKRGVISVRLKAKSRNGIAGTFYRIGEQGAVRYAEPFTVTATELSLLSYASVDAFGTTEPWKRPRKK